MKKTPHLVQYQGSKRVIAPEIVKYFPTSFHRLIEPFSGTCAITIFAAMKGLCDEFWINDNLRQSGTAAAFLPSCDPDFLPDKLRSDSRADAGFSQ